MVNPVQDCPCTKRAGPKSRWGKLTRLLRPYHGEGRKGCGRLSHFSPRTRRSGGIDACGAASREAGGNQRHDCQLQLAVDSVAVRFPPQ